MDAYAWNEKHGVGSAADGRVSVCDANRVSRFESRARRYFISGTEKGGKIDPPVFGFPVSRRRGTKEVARKGRGKRSAAMINTTGFKASLLFASPLFSFSFFFFYSFVNTIY